MLMHMHVHVYTCMMYVIRGDVRRDVQGCACVHVCVGSYELIWVKRTWHCVGANMQCTVLTMDYRDTQLACRPTLYLSVHVHVVGASKLKHFLYT